MEGENGYRETDEAMAAREQGEAIISLLQSPDINRLMTEANLTADEQDLIQELDTADQFVAMDPEKRQRLVDIYNKLKAVQ